jgi:hypothetical protein
LNQAGFEAIRFEVINSGIGSYEQAEEFITLRMKHFAPSPTFGGSCYGLQRTTLEFSNSSMIFGGTSRRIGYSDLELGTRRRATPRQGPVPPKSESTASSSDRRRAKTCVTPGGSRRRG